MFGIGAKGELRLGAGFAVEVSGAKRAAVGAGAIPLGKASASGRAENLHVHEGSLAAGDFAFWEYYCLVTPPPSPMDLWNHGVRGKTRKNPRAASG